MKTKMYFVQYSAKLDGHKKPVVRGFNTTARRELRESEIIARAKKHAAENSGEFVAFVGWEQ